MKFSIALSLTLLPALLLGAGPDHNSVECR